MRASSAAAHAVVVDHDGWGLRSNLPTGPRDLYPGESLTFLAQRSGFVGVPNQITVTWRREPGGTAWTRRLLLPPPPR